MAKRANFKQSAELISKLTPDIIKVAIEQVQNKQPITNKSMLELLKNINVVGGKIMGQINPLSPGKQRFGCVQQAG